MLSQKSPTLRGLKNFIQIYSTRDDVPNIKIAGYGTDSLSKRLNRLMLIIGSLTDSELLEVLSNASFCIINQPATSGFLTSVDMFSKNSYLCFIRLPSI